MRHPNHDSYLREKQRVCKMISLMPRLVVLEIGNAVDDAILKQVAMICSSLKKLTISGSEVTDRGIDCLCSGQELCNSLTSLSSPCLALSW